MHAGLLVASSLFRLCFCSVLYGVRINDTFPVRIATYELEVRCNNGWTAVLNDDAPVVLSAPVIAVPLSACGLHKYNTR